MNKNRRDHKKKAALSISIYEPNCIGCITCLKACPTRAIRIRNGKAVILPELCVDCGECMRVCPQHTIYPNVSSMSDRTRFKVTALLPSPVIYSQFGEDVMPNDILLALTKLGFDHVFDLAVYCEWSLVALDDWLDNNPQIRPALSSTCPVVTRLIQKRFPNLIPNIVPLAPPREVGARHIKAKLMKKYQLEASEIGVFYITPCAAKIMAINDPLNLQKSNLDGVLGLPSVYGEVLHNLKRLTEEDHETILFRASGFGIGWEVSGNECNALRHIDNALSVSGLTETLEILEQIDSERLSDIRYIQCHTCYGGSLGGPMTIENRFRASTTHRKLIQMFGSMPRIQSKDIAPLIERGYFDSNKKIKPAYHLLDKNPLEAMKKLKKVDELTALLPGKLCGVCGAPDCRSLAEDVVLGKASLSDCPFYDQEVAAKEKME